MNELKCFFTGQKLYDDNFIKLVLSPNNQLIWDYGNKFTKFKHIDCINDKRELLKGLISDKLREIWPDYNNDLLFADKIEVIYKQRMLDLIGLLNKSGSLIFGKPSIEAFIKKFTVNALKNLLLFQASNASAREKFKINELETIDIFEIDDLSAISGKENVVYILSKNHQMNNLFLGLYISYKKFTKG